MFDNDFPLVRAVIASFHNKNVSLLSFCFCGTNTAMKANCVLQVLNFHRTFPKMQTFCTWLYITAGAL